MIINFYKYHGTGNDFILIDDRKELFDIKNQNFIQTICERRFGIGADGLILLRNHNIYDFEMLFFNSTGERSTFCGNGGRCILAFSNYLGITAKEIKFWAYDGLHEGVVFEDMIKLKMRDVNQIDVNEKFITLDTGSPHLVKIVKDLKKIDVIKEGSKLRYSKEFGDYGINVNFVQIDKKISIRTYERGDEMESLSCGTGSVATAIALYEVEKSSSNNIDIYTEGGKLTVSFNYIDKKYTDIWLSGNAEMTYQGKIKC